MKKTLSISAAVLVAILFVTGCAGKKDIEGTGFLRDYSKMKQGQDNQALKRYIDPSVDFSRYDKVMIDKVVFYFKGDSKEVGIQPDELKMLADYFEKALVKALQDAYPVVTQPGPDVLRIRIAITGVKAGNPVLAPASAVLPLGAAVNALSNLTTGESISVGEASMEAEFLDSQTGRVIAQVMDHRTGSTYSTGTIGGKWGHAKEIFQDWAKRLRQWLDQVHGKKTD